MNAPPEKTRSGWLTFPITPAFASLSAIGVLDSATRVGLLTFLPFLLRDKGADLPTLGLALGLIFAGGAAGKLACGILASRLGILRSVILTETATACAILCMVFLPLSGEMLLCPVLGVVLNGTSSILYGSVPELVAPHARNEAFAFFYTVGIGSGAVAPFFYGLLGDALGVVTTLEIVAVMVLATTPLTFPLRGKLR
jgi:predicted MFS family arabinose efflux permease